MYCCGGVVAVAAAAATAGVVVEVVIVVVVAVVHDVVAVDRTTHKPHPNSFFVELSGHFVEEGRFRQGCAIGQVAPVRICLEESSRQYVRVIVQH